ncbi:hypothetical protein bthur0013_67670 [Bacillus thuringiensis IBL 200]|nr:hypothetical protein bthur0013_67670 [Bacillus thuringiensis IBL 200]KZD45604.1 hypothetical protein B4084_3716 [Bacillus cereus]
MLPEPFYNKISLVLFYYTNLQIIFLFFTESIQLTTRKCSLLLSSLL